MSVINPNETARTWRADKREPTVHLYLSGVEGDAAALIGARVAGLPLTLSIVPVTDWIDPSELATATVAVIQVDPDSSASLKRFQKLTASVETPLIAAAYEPPLSLVRQLVRSGARDVVPLPLDITDLETALAPLRDELSNRGRRAQSRNSKIVSIIKSVGGVGATAIATQLAVQFAQSEARAGREACLVDLDVQFGDAAFQLGLRPKLSLVELLGAGARLDGDLVRATATEHASGLKVIAAPPELMPLEGITSEHVIEVVEAAAREFGTAFVDLPSNWTNWSLSLLARSDLVLLVTELSVASLHRAKRQLALFESQDLDTANIRIIANRFEKGLLRTIRESDVKEALGRDISYTVANDFALMSAAIDRGIPIGEIKRKSAVGKDLAGLDNGIAAILGLER
jgi:pilus assembly protein CpaE